MKHKLLFVITFIFLTSVCFAFDYNSYRNIEYKEFIEYIKNTFEKESNKSSVTYFFSFNEKFRIKIQPKMIPQVLEKEGKNVFNQISMFTGYSVAQLDQLLGYYSVEPFDETDVQKGRVIFLWQKPLVPFLQKEYNGENPLYLYVLLTIYLDQQKNAFVIVNEFETKLEK